MNRSIKKLFWVLIAVCLSNTVVAQENKIDLGIGLGIWKYDEKESPNATLASVDFNAAYEVLDKLAVQANVGLGISSQNEQISNNSPFTIETGIKNHLSVYLRPQHKLEKVLLYALIGYSSAKVDQTLSNLASDQTTSKSETASGLSYGVGALISTRRDRAVHVEIKHQGDSSKFDLTGFVIGYSYRM